MTKRDLIAALTDYQDDDEIRVSLQEIGEGVLVEPIECLIDSVIGDESGLCYLVVRSLEYFTPLN